jgi:hypothetical protein
MVITLIPQMVIILVYIVSFLCLFFFLLCKPFYSKIQNGTPTYVLSQYCFVILYNILIFDYIYDQIVPSSCRYEVLSTKIEIRLAKAESIHWKSLEFTTETTVAPKAIVSSGNFRLIYSFLSFPSFLC